MHLCTHIPMRWMKAFDSQRYTNLLSTIGDSMHVHCTTGVSTIVKRRRDRKQIVPLEQSDKLFRHLYYGRRVRMQYIVSLLPLLACPVGMGLIMWLMMRGSKHQTPGQLDHMPEETYGQPGAVVEPPTIAKSLKRAATFNLLGRCLNWRVVAGLAVVGVIVLVVAPQFLWAALPLLIVAACPLSMLFMMRGMAASRSQASSQPSLMQGDSLPAYNLACRTSRQNRKPSPGKLPRSKARRSRSSLRPGQLRVPLMSGT